MSHLLSQYKLSHLLEKYTFAVYAITQSRLVPFGIGGLMD